MRQGTRNFAKITPTAPTVVGPGADEVFIRQIKTALTSTEIDELEADKNVVFFIGEVTFKDAFEKNRFLRFKWVLNAEGNRIGNFSEMENAQN